jgi:general secretion pathway protein F
LAVAEGRFAVRFEVKALRPGEGVVGVGIDALNAAEARAQAEARGYTVLAVGRPPWLRRLGRETPFVVVLFTQELLALLNAGLNLVEAIDALVEKEQRPEQRHVLARIRTSLGEGRPLSAALADFPAAFPTLYIEAVRASERTGDLALALGRYLAYRERLDAVRKQVLSASIYPALLIGVGLLILVFLMVYVVPRFSQIYADLRGELPLASRLLLSWGELLRDYGWILFGALAAACFLAWRVSKLPRLRASIARWAWSLPEVGERLRIYQFSRLYHTVGMLLKGGIPIVVALEMTEGLVSPAFRAAWRAAAGALRNGLPISTAFEQHGLTTAVGLRMLRVGERTGNMADMMERVASFYDDEIARWVEWFTRLFEPILMIFIGLLIGVIVVVMYMPIFSLADSIQ